MKCKCGWEFNIEDEGCCENCGILCCSDCYVTKHFNLSTEEYSCLKPRKQTSRTYKEYIASKQWKSKRLQFFSYLYYRHSKSNIICFCCRKELFLGQDAIHVHHKTYKNFQDENTKDLLSLCPNCHTNIHKINKSLGIELCECHKILRKVIRRSNFLKDRIDGLKNIASEKKKLERYIIYQTKQQLKPFKSLAL